MLMASCLCKGGDSDRSLKVYNAEEIQEILGIGRSKTYTFLDEAYRNQKPFRVLKVGKLFRVPKQSFDDWLDGIS